DVYNGDYIAEAGRKKAWGATVLARNTRTPSPRQKGFTKCLKAGLATASGTTTASSRTAFNPRQSPYQVPSGQGPPAPIQSATIHAAELIRSDDRVGRIAPGYLADVIAVNGNPLQDIRLLENAVFVMKDGVVQHRGSDTRAAQA